MLLKNIRVLVFSFMYLVSVDPMDRSNQKNVYSLDIYVFVPLVLCIMK